MKTLMFDFKALQKNYKKDSRSEHKENILKENIQIKNQIRLSRMNFFENKKNWNHKKKLLSIDEMKPNCTNERHLLKSSVVDLNFQTNNHIKMKPITSKQDPKVTFSIWKTSKSNKLKKSSNKIFASLNKNKQRKKRLSINWFFDKQSNGKNVNLKNPISSKKNADKTLNHLLKSEKKHKPLLYTPRKTNIIKFFLKNQIKKNKRHLKSKFNQSKDLSGKRKRSYVEKLKEQYSRDSQIEEEFNIFGNSESINRSMIYQKHNANNSSSLSSNNKKINKKKTAYKNSICLNHYANYNQSIESMNTINHSPKLNDEDIIKSHIDLHLKKLILEKNKTLKSKNSELVKNLKRKSQKNTSLKGSIRKISISGTNSIINPKLQIPLTNSFFNRRKTIIESNLTPKGIMKNTESKKEKKINYDKFLKNEAKENGKINFEKLNKTKISQLKSPKKNIINKTSTKESFYKKSNKRFGFRYMANSKSSDFSKHMALPNGFGDFLNRRHFLMNPNDYLEHWNAIPKTIGTLDQTKKNKFELLQYQKDQKLLQIRNQYKKLYVNHIREIQLSAKSFMKKCTLN